MTDKIKLEDMTLRQIGELKCYMANDIRKAISDIVSKYNNQYDCGIPNIRVYTEIEEQEFEIDSSWESEKITHVRHEVRIKFGKESHKKQQRRIRDIKAWWKKLTLEQAENLLSELETNPPKGLIVDDGFNTYKPPFSIIIMKKALREFIANKKKK